MLFPGCLFCPAIQAPRSSIIVDMSFAFTSRFPHLSWFTRQHRLELLSEGSLRTRAFEDFLFWLGFGQLNSMLGIGLAISYPPLLPPFFQVSQHICFSLTAFHHQVYTNCIFGKPAHLFNCLQQTGIQRSSYLFCPNAASIAWGHLCDDSLLVPWLSLWIHKVPVHWAKDGFC